VNRPIFKSGFLPREDTGVTQLSPFGDLRRVKPFGAKLRAALVVLDRGVIRGEVRQLLRWGE
jgi:hypothetical protein